MHELDTIRREAEEALGLTVKWGSGTYTHCAPLKSTRR